MAIILKIRESVRENMEVADVIVRLLLLSECTSCVVVVLRCRCQPLSS